MARLADQAAFLTKAGPMLATAAKTQRHISRTVDALGKVDAVFRDAREKMDAHGKLPDAEQRQKMATLEAAATELMDAMGGPEKALEMAAHLRRAAQAARAHGLESAPADAVPARLPACRIRRGYVGERRGRRGARRTRRVTRAGPRSSDPDLDDEHRRAS